MTTEDVVRTVRFASLYDRDSRKQISGLPIDGSHLGKEVVRYSHEHETQYRRESDGEGYRYEQTTSDATRRDERFATTPRKATTIPTSPLSPKHSASSRGIGVGIFHDDRD